MLHIIIIIIIIIILLIIITMVIIIITTRWVLERKKPASHCSIVCPCQGHHIVFIDIVMPKKSSASCSQKIVILTNTAYIREVLQSSAVSAARRLRASGDYILSKVFPSISYHIQDPLKSIPDVFFKEVVVMFTIC